VNPWSLAWRRFCRDRLGLVCLVVVLIYIVLMTATGAGWIVRDWSTEVGVSYASPSFLGAEVFHEKKQTDVPAPAQEDTRIVDPLANDLAEIAKELTGVQDLYDKGLATITRLAGLQREASRLDGERGQIIAAIAEAKSKISQTDIQLLRIDQDFRTEVTKELREAQDKEAELIERATAANDQLRRIEVRAPVAGLVHELAVHTIGGVIAPGETMMDIVPETDDLVIEARLPPQDIDQVQGGQTTHVRFPAFNQRTTPQLVGHVSYVSADLSHDKQSNATYYTVKVMLTASERRRLGDLQLVAGMPAEVFLQTTSRTMLSYLLKPITEQLARMFNER